MTKYKYQITKYKYKNKIYTYNQLKQQIEKENNKSGLSWWDLPSISEQISFLADTQQIKKVKNIKNYDRVLFDFILVSGAVLFLSLAPLMLLLCR